MHTHKEALTVLNCSKMTLSRYVKKKKLERIKKGRHTFYCEHQIAALSKDISDNQDKHRPDLPKQEKKQIQLPDEDKKILKNISSSDNLTKVGYEYLAEATENLKTLGLYNEVDKEILVLYALSAQNFYKYLYLANESDCLITSESGIISIHPYHRIMMDHEKMLLNYSDRLGFNPLARTKLDIKEKKEKSEMQKILDDEFGDLLNDN